MRFTSRFVASPALVGLALVAPGAALAKRAPITGQLDKPGYSVIAPADDVDGGMAMVRVRRGGRFAIRPPADVVALQLRTPDGRYGGPIVVGRKGRYGIVGVRAGARLGRIVVHVREGYARTAHTLRRRWRDDSHLARLRRGVPLGNGRNDGFVRSRAIKASAAARRRRGDRDSDGTPDTFDVAASGRLVLNNFERRSKARTSQEGEQPQPGAPLYLGAGLLQIAIDQTVNANAAALTVNDIDTTLATFGRIALDVPWQFTGKSPELDCDGLSYCMPGGSGVQTWPEAFDKGRAFPECCDDDQDGYGTIIPDWQLHHHAKSRDPALPPEVPQPGTIGTGDLLTEWVTQPTGDCVVTEPPTCLGQTLQFVFATVPALVAYNDTAGDCAKVPEAPGPCTTRFSYPVAPPGSDCSRPGCPGGLGTGSNGFPVAAPDGQDIEVRFTFWRPQRRPIPPETAPWTDIGRLNYMVAFGCDENGCGNKACPPDAFTVTPESGLAVATLPDTQGGVIDSAGDQPASPGNMFTFTVNLTKCMQDPRGFGVSGPVRWDVGQEKQLVFQATNLLDNAEQTIFFKRTG